MNNTSEKISDRDLLFYRKLRKNRVFNELLAYYARIAETEGVRKSHLAKRLGKKPSQITRWFSEPGNLCLDTISDLLLAMNAEMEFSVVPESQEEYSTEEFMEDFADSSQRNLPRKLYLISDGPSSKGPQSNSIATINMYSGENGEQAAATN